MGTAVKAHLTDNRVDAWLAALEQRHLAELTPQEVARALRALSSCYVERRTQLAEGRALATAGKRAAFALFYGPAHFLTVRHIVRALVPSGDVTYIYDLGCGTGAAGGAWALETGARVRGVDRHPWAVAEANWTYRRLTIDGRAARADMADVRMAGQPGAAILAAYSINELPPDARGAMLPRLLDAGTRGAAVLVIEPIARRLTPWWPEWETAFSAAGGVAQDWRIDTPLPERQHALAVAAGLDPRELTARSLWLRVRGSGFERARRTRSRIAV